MNGKAHFKVYGRFNGKSEATVTIDRGSNLISVRPHRMKKVYQLRLEDVADIIIWRIVKSEAAEKRALQKAKRKKFA